MIIVVCGDGRECAVAGVCGVGKWLVDIVKLVEIISGSGGDNEIG